MNRKKITYILAAAGGILILAYLLWPNPKLTDTIAIPYLAHQPPVPDPHLPSSDPLSDKLDEILFDGLFNISANPSGVLYEDGLGELYDSIDAGHVVTIQLKSGRLWHDSYSVKTDDDQVTISAGTPHEFTSKDLMHTLRRIEQLGSVSPDYILVSQALESFSFEGPDDKNRVRFRFRKDRVWTDNDIKEVLSFKIIPSGPVREGSALATGTGPYMVVPAIERMIRFHKTPSGSAVISWIHLVPFVDNSTYPAELRRGKINVLPDAPFGSTSMILDEPEKFFFKSNVSTTFFAAFFNTERLNREQRKALRALLDPAVILNRFYKTGSKQQRNITDYRGNANQYPDLLNYSVFPGTSYYVEEKIVPVEKSAPAVNWSLIPDTVRVRTCLDFGFREELLELTDILKDETLFKKRLQVIAVNNEDIRAGKYDVLLAAVPGYRSTFLFDMYQVFLREPDMSATRINLVTETEPSGKRRIADRSLTASKNIFRMDIETNRTEGNDFRKLLEAVYGFMETREVGDRQVYAQMIHERERELALAAWLFSMPSISYFSTRFEEPSIHLYGIASQLSTIEKWKEKKEK